jgi:hypothetical protein
MTKANGPWERSYILNAVTYFDVDGSSPALAIVGRTAFNEFNATTTISVCDLNGTLGANIEARSPTSTPQLIETLSQRWAPLPPSDTPVFLFCAGSATDPNGGVTGVATSFDGTQTLESTVGFTPSSVGALSMPRASYMTKCGLVTVYSAAIGGGVSNVFIALTVVVELGASVFTSAGVDVYASPPFPGGLSTSTHQLLNLPSDALPLVTWEGKVYATVLQGSDVLLEVVQVPENVGGNPTSFSVTTSNLGVFNTPKLLSLFDDGSLMIAADDGADLRLYGATYVAPGYEILQGSGDVTVSKSEYLTGALYSWASYTGTDVVPRPSIAWLNTTNTDSVILSINSASVTPLSISLFVTGRTDVTCTTFINSGNYSRLFLGFYLSSVPQVAIFGVQPDSGWNVSAYHDFGNTALANLFGSVIVAGTSALCIGGMENGTLYTTPFPA